MKNRQKRINASHERDFRQQVDELDWHPEIDAWDRWEESCRQFMDKLHIESGHLMNEYDRLYHFPLTRRLTRRTSNY